MKKTTTKKVKPTVKTAPKIKTATIKQTAVFKASPHDVYEMLMDSKKHAKFTGDKASISRTVGGKFSTFGGYATGKNVTLMADKKIVQTWRASDWDTDVVSTITFEFTKTATGTRLVFTQVGLPVDQKKSITDGWKDYYWAPMKAMLEGK